MSSTRWWHSNRIRRIQPSVVVVVEKQKPGHKSASDCRAGEDGFEAVQFSLMVACLLPGQQNMNVVATVRKTSRFLCVPPPQTSLGGLNIVIMDRLWCSLRKATRGRRCGRWSGTGNDTGFVLVQRYSVNFLGCTWGAQIICDHLMLDLLITFSHRTKLSQNLCIFNGHGRIILARWSDDPI